MTEFDLERELRDHYRSLDVGAPLRAANRVSNALDHAAIGHRRSLGGLLTSRDRRFLAAGAGFAVVAALIIAVLPIWHGPVIQPLSQPSATPTPFHLGAGQVQAAGITRGGVLWAIRDNNLVMSTNKGQTWHETWLPDPTGNHFANMPSGIEAYWMDVSVVDIDHATVVEYSPEGDRVVVFRTSDGGVTWQQGTLPGDYSGNARLVFVNAQVGFLVMYSSFPVMPSTILRTTDGGATWTVTGTNTILNDPFTAVDANTLWTATSLYAPGYQRPLLSVSHDAGATWTNVPLAGLGDTSSMPRGSINDPTIYPYLYVGTSGMGHAAGITFLTATEGYLAVYETPSQADFSKMTVHYYRTTDGGRTWTQAATTSPPAGTFASSATVYPMPGPVFLDSGHWYQPGMGGFSTSLGPVGLGISTDGGHTWTTVSKDGPGAGFIDDLFMTDGQNAAAVVVTESNQTSGDGPNYYLTHDGGKTWQAADFPAH